jgi:hypothetical protein
VEGAHGELSARLADRLRGYNANRFPKLDAKAGRKVASVAFGANASLGFAGKRRADLELLETDFLERRRSFLVDDLARFDNSLAGDGILDGLTGRASDDAGRETYNLLFSVPQSSSVIMTS